MKRIFISVLLIALSYSIFAAYSNIGVQYDGRDYVFRTNREVGKDDKEFFAGYYDACVSVLEGLKLHQIYSVIDLRTFPDEEGNPDPMKKDAYVNAFLDFMNRYSYGSIGRFSDLYAAYVLNMTVPASFESASRIVEFGNARFYRDNF